VGFGIKTAFAVKAAIPISEAGRSRLHPSLISKRQHTHQALADAIEQADIFGNIFEGRVCVGELSDRRTQTVACINKLREELPQAADLLVGKACVMQPDLLDDVRPVRTATLICLL